MASYYRRFIEGFSKIVKPMTALLAKKVGFKWTPACQESFKMLKQKLTTTPILVLPDVHKPFLVYCDASYTGLGCVCVNAGREVVAYSSRQLKVHEKNYDRTSQGIMPTYSCTCPKDLGQPCRCT
jgi:hypothetical protein